MTKVRHLPHVRFDHPARTKEKKGACRRVHPSTRRHNKTTTTTTMYATSATRCVTRRLKSIFSLHDTSRTRRLCDVSLSRDVRRWDGWFDDGTRLRGSSRPRRATRTTSLCPRSSNPAPRRLVVSSRGNNFYRFNRRRLGVDRASPGAERRDSFD
jgi:hypothetical protein